MKALALLCIAASGCGAGDRKGAGSANGGAHGSAVDGGARESGAGGIASRTDDGAGEGTAISAGPPRLAGDTLWFRFVDHAAEAEVSGDLAAGWNAIANHPQRALLPYAKLSGSAAFRAVEMAFADSDVEDYATARPPNFRPKPVRSYDPIWNRTRAVYSSRSALFLPAGTAQRYRVTLPPGARLETDLGLLALTGATGAAKGIFRITVDGHPVLERALDVVESWRSPAPGAIDLAAFAGRDVTIAFSVEGKGVAGLFADPIVWAKGGGAPGRNVLFIVVDTLRVDALAVMPRLQALAAWGARFDQSITAATWTRPSLLAMYGGDLPSAVGQSAAEMIPEGADRAAFYRRDPVLLPRLLSARGWRASAIGNNFFLLAYPAIGLDLGFEEVDDVRHPVLDTPAITRAAIRFLDDNRDRSWLLHLHYDAPHWPYTPPPEYLKKIGNWKGDAALQRDPDWARYLAEAAYADDAVGRVLDELDRLGIASRTLVVVVGDHGEVFDPAHAHIVEALGQPTLHHHGWSAYDEILRVPTIFALPGAIPAGAHGEQVRLYDLASTIADYLGVALPLPSRGRSLRPIIEGRDHADRPAFTEGQNIRALREGGWLYLRRDDGRLTQGQRRLVVREELYDVKADPAQHVNLVDRALDTLEHMRARFLAEAPPAPPDGAVVYHLRVAPDVIAHHIEATFRSAGHLAVRGASEAEVVPLDAHAVQLRFDRPGIVDLALDPGADFDVALTVDGLPFDPQRMLCGEFAIPIADGHFGGERLNWLDAPTPPAPGDRGAILLWRDTGSPVKASLVAAAGSQNDEVTGMMQRWGYAQAPPPKH